MEYQNTESEFRLNALAVDALREGSKWAFFLSIIGFIGIALMVVFAIFAGSIFASVGAIGGSDNPIMGSSAGMFTGIYVLMAVLYFFPVYYLFKFSSKAKSALKSMDTELLSNAFVYLKSHYKFLGILMIVMMSLYLLIIIGAVAFYSAM
jgi:hypothetical protein